MSMVGEGSDLDGTVTAGDAVTVQRFDVVIFGGGIAGIAIAELLSRLTPLRILVLEREASLGMGASSRLEGWYHTGALYAGVQDPQILINCLNSLEDLYNNYGAHSRFNGSLVQKKKVFTPMIQKQEDPIERWFNAHPVYFILPEESATDFRSRPINQYQLWRLQRSLLIHRLRNSFIAHNWQNKRGYCEAPKIKQLEENWAETVSEGLNLKLGARFKATSPIAKKLEKYCRAYDRGGKYEFFKSLDCSMNPDRILKDLVASSLNSGRVTFRRGVTLKEVIAVNREAINGVVFEESDGRTVHAKADFFVVASGANIRDLGGQNLFPTNKKVKSVQSAMVVVKPALEKLNFVRMALDHRYHFNHFYREYDHEGVRGDYSLLADSGYLEEREGSSSQSADHILRQAEKYFGRETLYGRDVYEYGCFKTEYLPEESEKRSYSYWVEYETGDNYVHVLPGKFSLFPSVALQTYRRIMEKNCFGKRQSDWPSWLEVKEFLQGKKLDIADDALRKAEEYVAPPFPQSIVTMRP